MELADLQVEIQNVFQIQNRKERNSTANYQT